jgi:hypothetical protein
LVNNITYVIADFSYSITGGGTLSDRVTIASSQGRLIVANQTGYPTVWAFSLLGAPVNEDPISDIYLSSLLIYRNNFRGIDPKILK